MSRCLPLSNGNRITVEGCRQMGAGFQLDDVDELSYGLRNIKERVEDMAGTIQLLTAPKQGLAVDIRIPLLDLVDKRK